MKYGILKVTAIKRFRLQLKCKQSKIKGKDHNSQTQFYKDIAAITQIYYQVCITYQHQLHVSATAPVAIFRLDTLFCLLYLFYLLYLYTFYDKILYPTWRWPQQQWPKHVADFDKLYTPRNIVVLWLLYPYRIINVGYNKHNGDDAPWKLKSNTAVFLALTGKKKRKRDFHKHQQKTNLQKKKPIPPFKTFNRLHNFYDLSFIYLCTISTGVLYIVVMYTSYSVSVGDPTMQ